jgi:hypothetical protein
MQGKTALARVAIKGFVVNSFTEGFRSVFVRAKKTEDDILAKCLWLENHGQPEEAEMLLESCCSR